MIAVPGDKVGVIEAFEPEGEYKLVDGDIVATVLSNVIIDKKEKKVRIQPIKKGTIKEGDIVIGRVDYIQRPFGFVTIISALNKDISTDIKGMIYINPEEEYPPVLEGSIIRARVAKLSAGVIILTVEDENLGVIESYCNFCGGPLTRRGKNTARCSWCGRVLKVKLAPDFRTKTPPYRVILE
ncbi:MAG: exosome complex RNA-binding protein Csl4 [Nitrososphaeria archaeon]